MIGMLMLGKMSTGMRKRGKSADQQDEQGRNDERIRTAQCNTNYGKQAGTGKSMEFLRGIITSGSLEAAHHGMISRTAGIISVEMKRRRDPSL